MNILPGWIKTRKYKKTASGYKKQSLDTSSETVYMNDGNTAETNLGAIKGITSSLTATNSNVALSASAGKSLQDQITQVNNNLTNINLNMANYTYLWQGRISQNTGIDFDFKEFKTVLLISESVIMFVNLYSDTMMNVTVGTPVLLYNGTTWVNAIKYVRFDKYPTRIYLHDIFDADFAGNVYRENRTLDGVVGIK